MPFYVIIQELALQVKRHSVGGVQQRLSQVQSCSRSKPFDRGRNRRFSRPQNRPQVQQVRVRKGRKTVWQPLLRGGGNSEPLPAPISGSPSHLIRWLTGIWLPQTMPTSAGGLGRLLVI